MMKRQLNILWALLWLPVAVMAQGDDSGLWLSLGADKKITKKVSVGFEAEARTRNDFATMDRVSLGIDAQYKFTKWLKISAGYSLLHDPNAERISYYESGDKKVEQQVASIGDPKKRGEFDITRHRVNVSLTGNVSFGLLNISLRERWQYTYRPEVTVEQRWSYYDEAWDGDAHTYRGKGRNVLRSRLQLEYKVKPLKLTPFASAEIFNAWAVTKTRYTIGADWKQSKHNVFTLAYRYQDVRNDDDDYEPDMHVVAVGYTYKF